jgi:hypothetical protein
MLGDVREYENGLSTPCYLMRAIDGRFTQNRIKVTFGYHISAFMKWGREFIKSIPAKKSSQ